MYISIKLPSTFGSFARLQKENYPFNNLFTAYLACISRLGLALSMDVDELVGYIEDRVFEGIRLPDIPEGNESVNIRYRTEDPDVVKYIGGSRLTNKMAVMYIARMTLRLTAAYGTSLFRLTRLITDLDSQAETVRVIRRPKEQTEKKQAPVETPKPKRKEQIPEQAPAPKPVEAPAAKQEEEQQPAQPMPRVSNRAQEQPQPVKQPVTQEQPASSAMASAQAAKEALNELTKLTEQAGQLNESGPKVETNPHLTEFFSI